MGPCQAIREMHARVLLCASSGGLSNVIYRSSELLYEIFPAESLYRHKPYGIFSRVQTVRFLEVLSNCCLTDCTNMIPTVRHVTL